MSTAVLSEPAAPAVATYEVGAGHTLLIRGKMYRGGDPIPAWFGDHDGGLPIRVAKGVLIPSNKVIPPGSIPAPIARTEADPAPAMAMEVDRLTRENQELAASNRDLVGKLAEVQAQSDGRTRALTQQLDEIAHWRSRYEVAAAKLADLEAKVAALEADLEAATKPAPKVTKPEVKTPVSK